MEDQDYGYIKIKLAKLIPKRASTRIIWLVGQKCSKLKSINIATMK